MNGSSLFADKLGLSGLRMRRAETTTLQINVGLLCNMSCRHCHLEAGPVREEVMSAATIGQVIDFAAKFNFSTIDITGGAPEMNPHICELISGLAPLTPRLMLRSNLTAMGLAGRQRLIDLCKKYKVVIVASFPALNEAQLEAQRGKGSFVESLAVLQKLNSLGYGIEKSGLELNLVSNPAGAFMPGDQKQQEDRFRQVLESKWQIVFNHLFSFTNVPLGRFRKWLEKSGNYDQYMESLVAKFNPCSLDGVMCRGLVSVSWDGYLYDCDFNLALDLPLSTGKVHLSDVESLPQADDEIAVGDHCFACTAGSGFT